MVEESAGASVENAAIAPIRNPQILFYCHFPDKLLSSHDSLLKNIYRTPIDWLEETTTGAVGQLLRANR
jgi:hypothetical protein